MTGKSLSHVLGSQLITQHSVPVVKKTAPEDKLPHSKSNENRIDELLRAFSDVAYSSEEQELPWESWNYHRISAF